MVKVPIRYNGGESQNMEILIVKGDRPLLFGRDWLTQISLDWKGIFRVSESTSTAESEFMGGSEWPKGFTKFLKEKANLFSHKGTGVKDVEKEYERLVESGIFFRLHTVNGPLPQFMCLRRQRGLHVTVCGDYK